MGFRRIHGSDATYANFGPPPGSESMMAIMALVFYLLFAVLAAAVERIRTHA
jgi:hypothetical protein